MAKEEDLLSIDVRKEFITEILADENQQRKRDAKIKHDIWRGRLHEYLVQDLKEEMPPQTVNEMRKISSVNFVERIIREKSPLYREAPERFFQDATPQEEEHLKSIYDESKINVMLKKGNEVYKLHEQDTIQIIPKKGKISARILSPLYYDVIPEEDSPEDAMAYIVSLTFDEERFFQADYKSTYQKRARDFIDQKIADQDDVTRLEKMRFAWWTNNYNFITDGMGKVVGDPADVLNPLGELPFIDVAKAEDKDFKYWVNNDSKVVRFQRDFSKVLSDTAEVSNRQGYAIGFVTAVKKPKTVNMGPGKMVFLPLDPNKPELKPEFDFKTPSPDLQGSLSVMEFIMLSFLASEGLDSKNFAGSLKAEGFSSGIERFLAMLQQFDTTKSDIDLFKWVESEVLRKIIKYNNLLLGSPLFREGTNRQTLNENISVRVEYKRPEVVQTKKEKEDSAILQLREGVMSKLEVIQALRHVDKEEAEEILKEIEKENFSLAPIVDITGNPIEENENANNKT